MGHKLLVDGGVVERLPISLAKKMGATTIIAVDVLGRIRMGADHYNMISLLTRVFDIMDENNTYNKIKKQKPDLLLTPELGNLSTYNFRNHEETYHAGYDVVVDNIKEIKSVIAKNNAKLSKK